MTCLCVCGDGGVVDGRVQVYVCVCVHACEIMHTCMTEYA